MSESKATTKVEKLSENLKHLDKPGWRETPRRSWAYDTTHAGYIQGFYWGRKVAGGRNKLQPVFLLGDEFERGLAVQVALLRSPRAHLSRSALLRWFPVALENTTYSDAITRANVSSNGAIKRGYLVYSTANTRHYSNTTMRDKRVWYQGNKAR